MVTRYKKRGVQILIKKCTISNQNSFIIKLTEIYNKKAIKVIEIAQYDYIKYLYFNEGLIHRVIAKKVGVPRNTVRRALSNDSSNYILTTVKEKLVFLVYES